jgi:hypothetical protein
MQTAAAPHVGRTGCCFGFRKEIWSEWLSSGLALGKGNVLAGPTLVGLGAEASSGFQGIYYFVNRHAATGVAVKQLLLMRFGAEGSAFGKGNNCRN